MKSYNPHFGRKPMGIYKKNILYSFLMTLLYFFVVEVMTFTVLTTNVSNIFVWAIVIMSALIGGATVFLVKRNSIKEYILSIIVIAVTFYAMFYILGLLNNGKFGVSGVNAYINILNISAVYYFGASLICFIYSSTVTILKNINNQDQNKLY